MDTPENLLGTLEPTAASSRGRDDWIALIGSHPCLAGISPVVGKNPFTGQALRFTPRRDTARVMDHGHAIGYISWAEDDSGTLAVWSRYDSSTEVETVASDVARLLGWRFVRSRAA
jgi:hypothetical protein